MGHGRREPPEQGSVDERVDGNRREPVLRLARARRFRPTRQRYVRVYVHVSAAFVWD